MQYYSPWIVIWNCEIYTKLHYIYTTLHFIFTLQRTLEPCIQLQPGRLSFMPQNFQPPYLSPPLYPSSLYPPSTSKDPTCRVFGLFVHPCLKISGLIQQQAILATCCMTFMTFFVPRQNIWIFVFMRQKYQDICSAVGTFKVQMFTLVSVPLFWLHEPKRKIFFWF